MLTFAFTDIAGSTRLWERAPDAMRESLARHDALIRTIALDHHGTVFKTVGDASYCVFDNPSDAVLAAVEIQRRLATETWPESIGTLRVRIGIHTGDATSSDGDYFGPTLNRVARVTAAGHGGQILVSATTVGLIGDRLGDSLNVVDLGAHRLKDLLRPESIFQITGAGLARDFAPLKTLDAKPNNLPSQLSSFVGRELELRDLNTALLTQRLTTIAGPAGIGKTRLGLQAAADSIGRFHDGSWIVRLEDTGADFAAQAIAGALHVPDVAGQPIEDSLLDALRDKTLFLFLDNTERIVAALAQLVHRILNTCPSVVILVTSREPLHITGEYVVRIGPMDAASATRLFTARAVQSSHAATRHDDEKIIERICARLDGSPLAIELAAARVSTFGAAELERRLQSDLKLLVAKDPSGSERHRTITSAIDWSYRLLSLDEQRFLASLSLFEGGFALDAAEAIASEAGEVDALMLLDALVDKSLVTAEPANEAMRYRLLELIRDYARQRLDESHETDPIARRHFDHFKRFADRWGQWTDESEEHRYVTQLEREVPNMRAALAWGLARDDRKPAFALLQKFAGYWQLRCIIREARDWFERALNVSGSADERTVAALLRRAATFATIDDDYRVARDLTQRSLEQYERAGDQSGVSEALHNLAVIEDRCGNSDIAQALYTRAYDGFVATSHHAGMITALYNLGQGAMKRAEISEAEQFFERGLALCDTAADADKRASLLMASGDVALCQRRIDEADRIFTEALQLKRELGSDFDEAEALRGLALIHMRREDWAGALRYAREGLEIANRLQIASLTLGFFEALAVIRWNTGGVHEAEELVALADMLRDHTQYSYDILREIQPELDALRAAIGSETLTALKDQARSKDWRACAQALLAAP